MTGDYRMSDEDIDETELTQDGVTVQHDILAGLFSQDHYLPVGMFSGLANSSYDYFNSKGKIDSVHEGLQNSKYNYIDDLKDF